MHRSAPRQRAIGELVGRLLFRSFVLCAVFLAGIAPGRAAGKESRLPADLTLPDVTGRPTKLDFSAAPLTLVNFWATWCGPCREEMPEIVKLVDKHGAGGFRAIGVALESGEAAEVKTFLEENRSLGINYPILVGDDSTADRFGGIEIVPTTYLVDGTGTIVSRFLGVSPGFSNKVAAEIRRVLGSKKTEKAVAPAAPADSAGPPRP